MGLVHIALVLGLACAAASPEGNLLRVSGAPADLAFVNGDYKVSNDHRNGRPCFNKRDATDVWLCVGPGGVWNFQPASKLGTTSAWIASDARGATSPAAVRGWKAWRQASWAPLAALRVEGGGAGGGAGFAGNVYTDAEMDELKWTVSVMMLGAIAGIGILMSLLGGNDPRIRSHAYKMLSSTISTFLGVIVNLAVKALIVDVILPMFSTCTGPDEAELSSEVTIVAGFVLFTSVFVLIIFLCWKFQYSQGRLWAVKKFGSSMCAWGAVFAFQEILEVFVDEADPGLRIPAAATIALLAFCLFSIYEKASDALIADCFSRPPRHPWPPPRLPLIYTGPKVQTPRTCTGLWYEEIQQHVPQAVPVDTMDWVEEVEESQDDVLIAIDGFLINQAIIYGSTNKLMSLTERHNPVYQWEVHFWAEVCLILMGVSFGLFLLRAYFSDSSWAGSMTQRILLSSMGFCMYRGCNWQMRLFLGQDNPIEPVADAVVLSTLAILIVIFLDRGMNLLAWVAPACFAKIHGRFRGTKRKTPIEWAMDLLIKVLGLVAGTAWGVAFSAGFTDIIDTHPALAANRVLSKITLSVVFTFVVLPPWRRTLVPLAEMSERVHAESVAAEHAHLAEGESFET